MSIAPDERMSALLSDRQTLAQKVAFLRRPESYPAPASPVQALETHMSWLFLTGEHAYKLKKPFRRVPVDYSTPAARRRSCVRELRLNQRLAPEIYLSIEPLTIDADGAMALNGPGRRIDWLLRMRRLPAALSLEQRLRANSVDSADAQRIVTMLGPLFAAEPHSRWSCAAYRRRLLSAINAAASELARPELGLSDAGLDTLAGALRYFIDTCGELLDARVLTGRIVEGHGDLRPEHIYLTDPPIVIDCIEFDRNLRLRDPVDELAFLAMEADRLGRPVFDGWLMAAYRDMTGDLAPRALIEFHKARNALVRAQIAAWHLEDPDTGPPQQWIGRARDYLRCAQRYLTWF